MFRLPSLSLSQWKAGLEIAFLVVLFYVALWLKLSPPFQFITVAASVLLIVYPIGSNLIQKRSADQTGFRRAGFKPGLQACLLLGIPISLGLYYFLPAGPFRFYRPGMRFVVGSLIFHVSTFSRYTLVYLFLVVTQEYIHMGFLFNRLYELFSRDAGRAAVWGLVLFTLQHHPNSVLMVFSFFGGILFFSVYAKYRNILPLIALHWVLGLLVYQLTFSFAPSLAVGRGYYSTEAAFNPLSRLR